MYEGMEMRVVFAKELDRIMANDSRIVLLDADLSKANGRAELHKKYPNRSFNVGVAEANMIGVASGLSSYGFIPFTSTFTPFSTRRVCDQITISATYAKQNVKIIGTDPGLSAEFNGGTHMSVEDIGVLRSIPDLVIFEPVDNTQLVKSIPHIINYYGTVYIRLFRKVTPDVFSDDYEFDLFKADILHKGNDVTLIASGMMVKPALDAKDQLEKQGLSVEVINVHTIKPIDQHTIIESVKKTKAVVTIENHNVIGGLYSAVSEVLAANYPVPAENIGIQDRFGQVGKLKFLIPEYQMTVEDIVEKTKKVIRRKHECFR